MNAYHSSGIWMEQQLTLENPSGVRLVKLCDGGTLMDRIVFTGDRNDENGRSFTLTLPQIPSKTLVSTCLVNHLRVSTTTLDFTNSLLPPEAGKVCGVFFRSKSGRQRFLNELMADSVVDIDGALTLSSKSHPQIPEPEIYFDEAGFKLVEQMPHMTCVPLMGGVTLFCEIPLCHSFDFFGVVDRCLGLLEYKDAGKCSMLVLNFQMVMHSRGEQEYEYAVGLIDYLRDEAVDRNIPIVFTMQYDDAHQPLEDEIVEATGEEIVTAIAFRMVDTDQAGVKALMINAMNWNHDDDEWDNDGIVEIREYEEDEIIEIPDSDDEKNDDADPQKEEKDDDDGDE